MMFLPHHEPAPLVDAQTVSKPQVVAEDDAGRAPRGRGRFLLLQVGNGLPGERIEGKEAIEGSIVVSIGVMQGAPEDGRARANLPVATGKLPGRHLDRAAQIGGKFCFSLRTEADVGNVRVFGVRAGKVALGEKVFCSAPGSVSLENSASSRLRVGPGTFSIAAEIPKARINLDEVGANNVGAVEVTGEIGEERHGNVVKAVNPGDF